MKQNTTEYDFRHYKIKIEFSGNEEDTNKIKQNIMKIIYAGYEKRTKIVQADFL